MNSDIRLQVSFRNHRKRRRLIRLIGIGATHYLVNLWITAAESRPLGTLTSWDETDIADASDWSGDPKEYVDALVECGWLEKDDGTYRLHDWEKHQGWVCGAQARSEHARKAALAKYQRLGCSEDAPSEQPAELGNDPSPSPSPIPTPSPVHTPTPFPRRAAHPSRRPIGHKEPDDPEKTKKVNTENNERIAAREKFLSLKKGKNSVREEAKGL